jgi:hypothetical protein
MPRPKSIPAKTPARTPKIRPTPTFTTDFTNPIAFTMMLSPRMSNVRLTILDWVCNFFGLNYKIKSILNDKYYLDKLIKAENIKDIYI